MTFVADLRMIRHSGIGRYLRNLIPLLLPLLHTRSVRVLADPAVLGSPDWLRHPGLELIPTTAPIYSLAEQALAFHPALRSADLLWVPHYNVPLAVRRPLLVTMHDIAPLALPEILSSPLKRAVARRLITNAVHQASHILCVSRFTQAELHRRLDITPDRTTVTPLGLDRDWPTAAAPHLEADGRPYVLFVGNVKPNKNLTLLLDAFGHVLDRMPHRLVLAGRLRGFSTGDEAVLERAVHFGDRVRFAGEVEDAALASLYTGASALVLPSLYEGFGLPVLEAMHLGCPVLASTAGSLPEVAGDAALFFNPRSSDELAGRLLQLLDPAVTNGMRERGLARAAQFSFARCAEQTAAVMNRLLGSTPEVAP